MVVKIITGSNYKKYLSKGYVEFPENHFWGDDVLKVVEAFLIAGRTRNITIITRDAMMIEAFECMTVDNDGQVVFFLDDTHDCETTKKEIDPSVLCILYDTMARGYNNIDLHRYILKLKEE